MQVTQTWLRDSSDLTDISGYNFVHNPRKDRTGRDVGLYLADNFDFKCRADIVFSCTECDESFFVEINRPKSKKYNIVLSGQGFIGSFDLP